MSQALVKVRLETAEAFLSSELHDGGAIDLAALAAMAHAAIERSDKSLAAAKAISGGALWERWYKSGDMQRHVIESITHIRDISKVNLGLSAICNDLAAANLEHARRIDSNHRATNIGLDEIKTLTAELLDYLRRPRDPSLLDGLKSLLSASSPTDQNLMHGWLHELSDAIDLQYATLLDHLNGLTKHLNSSDEAWVRIRMELAELGATVERQKAEANRQLALNSDRFSGILAQLDRRFSDVLVEVACQVASVDNKLADSRRHWAIELRLIEQQLVSQGEQQVYAIATERGSRESMPKALVGILKQNEASLRYEISEQKRRANQRMIWITGVLLIFQIAGFAFLSIKTGLWS